MSSNDSVGYSHNQRKGDRYYTQLSQKFYKVLYANQLKNFNAWHLKPTKIKFTLRDCSYIAHR